ncbi:MAG: PepSY domain-containing protein [Caulobacteraceae bacterium]
MNRIAIVLSLAAAVAATGGMAQAKPPAHYAGWTLASSAHVTMSQARRIALQARPGVITDQELEKERGGSGLRYSFDIKAGGKTFEVGVDAQTGKVLENDAEGRNPD